MKSAGVYDVYKWLEQKCKDQKKIVDKKEDELKKAKSTYYFDDETCLIDSAEREFRDAQIKLKTLVEIKIGTEKYYKKLKHQENESNSNGFI